MPFKLIDKQKRAVLGEGRNRGVGYAFAKRTGDTLTTVCPISPCKDYLNDQLFSEATGKPYNACGLSTTKQDIFDTHAYLIASICKQGCRELKEYPEYKADLAALEANHPAMQKAINWLEDQLKIDGRTSIEQIAANQYVIVTPLYWTQYTYLISLYTLVIRAALYWDGKGDPETYLTSSLKDNDAYTIKQAWPKVKRMIAGELPKQDFNDPAMNRWPGQWHGAGICFWAFPPTAEELAAKEAIAKAMATPVKVVPPQVVVPILA